MRQLNRWIRLPLIPPGRANSSRDAEQAHAQVKIDPLGIFDLNNSNKRCRLSRDLDCGRGEFAAPLAGSVRLLDDRSRIFSCALRYRSP